MPTADAATPRRCRRGRPPRRAPGSCRPRPNGPCRAMNATGCGVRCGESQRAPRSPIADPPRRAPAGISRRSRRQRCDPSRGQRQLPPFAVERDAASSASGSMARARSERRRRWRAISMPVASDISCSADGTPGSTAIARRLHAHRLPARPIAGEDDLEDELDARFARHPLAHQLAQAAHVAAPSPAWSLTMKLACFSLTTAPPMRSALETQAVDDRAGRLALRIAKDAARRGQAERLVLLAPAPDLVEPRRRSRRRSAGSSSKAAQVTTSGRPAGGECLSTLSR